MKRLQCNFTTPEQSKRLLELGVPADSADCYYLREHDDKVYLFQNQKEYDNCISKIRLRIGLGHAMPCWSVGRLIEIFETCTSTKFERWSHKGVIRPLLEDCIEHIKFALNPDTIMKFDFSKLEE